MSVHHKPTQNQQILDYIEEHGSITPLDAMNEFGCMRLASRISDLKRKGYPIVSTFDDVYNRNGEKVRIKRYSLAKGGESTNEGQTA